MDSQDYYRKRMEEAFRKIEEALRQRDSDSLFSYIRLVRELERKAAEELKSDSKDGQKSME